MANWGPTSVSIGPGVATPDHRTVPLFDTGVFVPLQVLRIGGTVTVGFSGGRSDAVWDVHADAYDSNGQLIDNYNHLLQFRLTTTGGTFNYNIPVGSVRVVISFAGALYAGQTMSCTASGTFDNTGYCQFGTRPKAQTVPVVVLTQAVIDAALTFVGEGWLSFGLGALAGTALDTTALCAQGPPQLPNVNNTLVTQSPEFKLEVLKAVTWNNWCECVPGSPTPTPPPNPVVTQPPGSPTAPTFPCDPAALCTSIVQILQMLNQLQGEMSNVDQLVTFLQRYRLPFATIDGAVHSGLSGAGAFNVSRLAGMRVTITAKPPNTVDLPGNPPYLIDMGWLSITDPSGMYAEKRLTRDSQIWLPPEFPTATAFQWDLFPGVVVQATELEAEP